MSRYFGILCALFACTYANAQTVQPNYFEEINDLTVVMAASIGSVDERPLRMSFSALGRQFDLELQSNAGIDGKVRERGRVIGARAYRGALVDTPDSWVRIVINNGQPSGVIWDGSNLIAIERSPNSASSTVVYRAEDVYVPPNTLACGMHNNSDPINGMTLLASIGEDFVAAPAAVTLNLDIGLVADFEFTTLYANPGAALLERMNIVDGIFSEQLGVRINVQQVDIFDDAGTDPFTDTIDSGELLEELAVYRGATAAQDAMGLTHLFTGRDLDGSTVGVAYLGALCQQLSPLEPQMRSFGSGLTQATAGLPTMTQSLIAAHEIGHNFGAPHDGDIDAACAAEPDDMFLMAPSLNGSSQFSACSISEMQLEIASASCLTPANFADNAITGSSAVTTPAQNTDFNYVFTVANNGGDIATGSTLAINFDPNFTVLQIQPESGTCDAPQSNVNCSLGDIPGSSSRTVTTTLRSIDTGTRQITATVSSADDSNMANDDLNDTVNILAAADLQVQGNSFNLAIDESLPISTQLSNLSNNTANGISLSATHTTALDVVSADIDGQTCSISATSFNCTLASLNGLANAQLNVTVRGNTVGSAIIAVTVDSQETDPNIANNTAQLVMNISATSTSPQPNTGGNDDGGGGSTGILVILALALTWVRKRQFFSSL